MNYLQTKIIKTSKNKEYMSKNQSYFVDINVFNYLFQYILTNFN